MSFPSQYNSDGITEFERINLELKGQSLVLHCKLPNGKVEEIHVNGGQDVAYAKCQLAKKLDISYNAIHFYLGNKLMIDPLSFNDFPEITHGQVNVKVLIKN